MKYKFDYLYTLMPTAEIDIEDISNFTLVLYNDIGQEWYIDIQTDLGETKITKYGPLTVDSDTINNYFKFEYCKINYKEQKIISEVDKFINSDKSNVTQVFEIDKETFQNRLKEIFYAATDSQNSY